MWYKNITGRFFGLVTKHACDRRTNGQNYDSRDRASIAVSRGKNGQMLSTKCYFVLYYVIYYSLFFTFHCYRFLLNKGVCISAVKHVKMLLKTLLCVADANVYSTRLKMQDNKTTLNRGRSQLYSET